MKLTELKPEWWAPANSGRRGIAVVFDCPCCHGTPKGVRLCISINPPLDGGAPVICTGPYLYHADNHGIDDNWIGCEVAWQRTGDTFENLTLVPSVDASKSGHWHGFVTGGEIR